MESVLTMFLFVCCYATTQKLKRSFKCHTNGSRTEKRKLPPGPPSLAALAMLPFLSLRQPSDLGRVLGMLQRRYGPIVTMRLHPSYPTIIVTGRQLIREALIEKGAAFAARPGGIEPSPVPIIGAISTATYGPRWRLLRQSLAGGIFHPSYIRSLDGGRRWALDRLKGSLISQATSNSGVVEVRVGLECAVLSLLGLMCYGEKLEEGLINDMREAHNELMSIYNELSFTFLGKLVDYFFGTRSKALLAIRRKHEETFIPLVRERRSQQKLQQQQMTHCCYVDSLLDLRLPDGDACQLDDVEIITICSELLSAGAEQISTTVEWIIANLSTNPAMLQRLVEEIQRVMEEDGGSELKEESLEKMAYLNAVVLEGLRRHPPSNLLLPHAVSTEVTLGGYLVPRDANILFTVGDMGSDESIWSEPWEFRPERFLPGGEGERVDLTGKRDLKMMPFGLGRRTCPSPGFSSPLLKYFVAHMVKDFRWESVEGEAIDMAGKVGLAVTMSTPLQVRISHRFGE